MRKVVLADGTIINNCNDSTTANSILVEGSTYAAVAASRDVINSENAKIIKILDAADDKELSVATDLILLPGCVITQNGDIIRAEIQTRYKTREEIMQDQIEELQEAIIGE